MNCLDNNVIVLDWYWTKLSIERNHTYDLPTKHHLENLIQVKECNKDTKNNSIRRPTLTEEYKESLNPRTKEWRGSLRSWELSYEDRTYRTNVVSKPKTVVSQKADNVADEKSGKQNKSTKPSKKNKSVRWSKKTKKK